MTTPKLLMQKYYADLLKRKFGREFENEIMTSCCNIKNRQDYNKLYRKINRHVASPLKINRKTICIRPSSKGDIDEMQKYYADLLKRKFGRDFENEIISSCCNIKSSQDYNKLYCKINFKNNQIHHPDKLKQYHEKAKKPLKIKKKVCSIDDIDDNDMRMIF